VSDSDTAVELVDVIRRRFEILTCLVEEPREKRTLVDELGAPRSTLDRAVRELEAVELVTYTEGEYTITPLGERLTNEFCAFLGRVDVALDLAPACQHMPIDEFDLDLRLLADAEMVVPNSDNPYAMIDRHVQQLATMDHARAMLPLTGLHAHETAHVRIVEHGAEVELVVEPGVAELMVSGSAFAPLTNEMLATDRFDLFVSEESIPYFVGIIDDIVQLGVDEAGNPRAIVETDRQSVREWAQEKIDAYKRQAMPITQTGLHEPIRS